MMEPMINLHVVRAVKGLSDGTLVEISKSEGDMPYFEALDEDGVYLVDNDAPRDGPYTEELMQKTLGFALVDSAGRIHGKFKTLARAESALANAKIDFGVTVDVEQDEEEDTNG